MPDVKNARGRAKLLLSRAPVGRATPYRLEFVGQWNSGAICVTIESMKKTIVLTLLIQIAAHVTAAEPPVDFNRDIRSILAENCFACHGPDEKTREADLRLDTAAGAIADLGGSRAIDPANPDASELISRIESDDPDAVMPPPDSGHQLTDEQKQLLRRWVAGGGEYEIHWSFVAPVKAPLPNVVMANWPRHAIDYFVLAKLEAAGLSPTAEADRYQLIRRVSLDLTGLPPTPEQAAAFVVDRSEDAYEKVVDRLLKSDAFGEHWARMWLDLARYADTKGYEKDLPREMWRYRDWVIDAINKDTPLDQFTLEQLAGDLLPNPTTDQRIATAFHRNTMVNDEGGTDNEEFRVAAVKDRVDTTMQVWMGLTMGCAKCHSHKYDPITQSDYYKFYAIFNQTEDADKSNDAPTLPTPTRAQQSEIAELETKITTLRQQFAEESPAFDDAYKKWRQQFESAPLWKPLTKSGFASKHNVALQQHDDGTLIATGDQPEKDTWQIMFDLPTSGSLTALRLDVFSKDSSAGNWPDRNVAIRELSAAISEDNGEPKNIKLTRARADFSQQGWEVAKAIDGNQDVGWAIAPQLGKPHAAVFDFEKPISAKRNSQLRLTLQMEHGGHLLLSQFRIAVSTHPPKYLTADVDVESGLRSLFKRDEFPPSKTIHEQLIATEKKLAELRGSIPNTPIMRELAENKQRQTRVHIRGNFLEAGEPVQPAVPELFGRLPDGCQPNRLGVARWLMQPENPLTARVMLNRIWARLFGVGLVETEEDFGTQGMLPSHPGLLDSLAVDFRQGGWSLKKLLRTIVLSSTYRQSSAVSQDRLQVDPQNRLLSRGPRFRLSAETVRDQALAVSGLLTAKIGGPSVMPPQPGGVWKSTYSALKWQDAAGPDRYRRAIYTYWKRTSPYPAMTTFDAGSGEVCQIRRVRTNTPLQALVTLNDPAFFEAAGSLASKMSAAGGTTADKINHGFRRVLIRLPDEQETSRLVTLYESLRNDFADDDAAATELLRSAGLSDGDAAMVAVANVLLNLDETLMKP